MYKLLLFVIIFGVNGCGGQHEIGERPLKVIFDTDLGSDYDDVGALAMLHALEDQGRIQILCIGTSNKLPHSVPIIRIINEYYGKKYLPVGTVGEDGIALDCWHREKWTDYIVERYRKEISDSVIVRDAVSVYREALANQPDQSVSIVTVGFLTNLKNLLMSAPDRHSGLSGIELVRRKVRTLTAMAGMFPKGRETNIIVDVESAQYVFKHWPTEVLLSGYEIGKPVRTGDWLIAQNIPKKSPVREIYELAIKQDKQERDINSRYMDGGRASYDQTAVLAAVGPLDNYFNVESGEIVVADDGLNIWHPDPNGRHKRLIQKMEPKDLAWIIEELMMEFPIANYD